MHPSPWPSYLEAMERANVGERLNVRETAVGWGRAADCVFSSRVESVASMFVGGRPGCDSDLLRRLQEQVGKGKEVARPMERQAERCTMTVVSYDGAHVYVVKSPVAWVSVSLWRQWEIIAPSRAYVLSPPYQGEEPWLALVGGTREEAALMEAREMLGLAAAGPTRSRPTQSKVRWTAIEERKLLM